MSETKIYVGNLSYNTTQDELRDHFSQFGTIQDVKVIMDMATNRSKGFGFITFSSSSESELAVEKSKETELDGRKIKVNMARSDNGGAQRTRNFDPQRRSFYRDRDRN